MADETLFRRLKQRLAARYPQWVGAYHQVRYDVSLRRRYRRRSCSRTPHGFVFFGHEAMESGTFEPQETRFLLDRLRDTDVFVDVGANAGYFVCLARQQHVHPIAIEPAPGNLELLFRNLSANGWTDVEVFPLAMGQRPGLVRLFGEGTSASTTPSWAGLSPAWHRDVPLSSLDILLGNRFDGRRLLIKVDVEGAEYDVVAGALSLLSRDPAPCWLVEICLTENLPPGRQNPRFAATFELFWSHGYRACSLEGGRAVEPIDVARWSASGTRDFGYVSYVFEKPACRQE